MIGAALKLRVELDTDEKTLFAQLHRLHNVAVRGLAAETEPLLLERRAIVVVEFVAVTVLLADLLHTVAAAHDGPFRDAAGISAEPQCAALAYRFILIG